MNKCESCMYFEPIIKNEKPKSMGTCQNALKPKIAKYHQRSEKACRFYLKSEAEKENKS